MAKKLYKYQMSAHGVRGKIVRTQIAPTFQTAKAILQADTRKTHGQLTRVILISKKALKPWPHPL